MNVNNAKFKVPGTGYTVWVNANPIQCLQIVPGTAAVRRRRQSMKPPVEVSRWTIDPPPIAVPAAAKLIDLMHFVQLHQRVFGNAVVVAVNEQ